MKYSKHLPNSKNSPRKGITPPQRNLAEVGYRRRFFEYQVEMSDNPDEIVFLVEREIRVEPAIPGRRKN